MSSQLPIKGLAIVLSLTANATTCVRRDLITGTLDLFRCPGDNDLDDNVYANRTANSSKTFCCGSDSTRYCCDSLEYQM